MCCRPPRPLRRAWQRAGGDARHRLLANAAPALVTARAAPSRFTPREGSGAPQGAPYSALVRRSARLAMTRSPRGAPPAAFFGSGPRFSQPIRPGLQRAPRAGVIVPPGRVPEPPETPADEAGGAGAAQANALSRIRPGTAWADLRPRIPLAPSIQRHRLTPLDEQGADRVRAVFCAGISFFRKVIPADLS